MYVYGGEGPGRLMYLYRGGSWLPHVPLGGEVLAAPCAFIGGVPAAPCTFIGERSWLPLYFYGGGPDCPMYLYGGGS